MRQSRFRSPSLRWLIALTVVGAVACGNGEATDDADGADTADTDATDTDDGDADEGDDADEGGADEGDAEAASDLEPVSWQYASYLAPGSSLMDAISNYLAEVNEGTDGTTEVEEFFQEALLGATDILGGVADGRAELGFTIALYHPGELPLSQVVGVPFVTEDAEAQIRTFNELYETNDAFRSEWQAQGVHVLSFTPLTNSIIATTDPIDGLDDLEGKSIRSVGFLAAAMEAIGVNPVALPAPEIFESLERGVIDGASSYPFDVFVANGLDEAAPYISEPGTGLYNLGVIIVDQDVWDSMDPERQQVMTDMIDDFYVEHSLELLADEEALRCDEFLADGGSPNVFSDEEIAEWESAVGDSVLDRWRSGAIDGGVSEADVDAFFEEYTATLESYEAESSYTPGLRACAERAG